eukprot:COSAG02_NODE_1122_length_14450_cov_4.124173_8_plen_100_part_00
MFDTDSTSLREVKVAVSPEKRQWENSEEPRGSRRRVSNVTKEPIPTEKLNVLEQNFQRHHYVSPEVSAVHSLHTPCHPRTHAQCLLTDYCSNLCSCGPN